MVTSHGVVLNPYHLVRSVQCQVLDGKTAEISLSQAKRLFAAIDLGSPMGLRDRAMLRPSSPPAAGSGRFAGCGSATCAVTRTAGLTAAMRKTGAKETQANPCACVRGKNRLSPSLKFGALFDDAGKWVGENFYFVEKFDLDFNQKDLAHFLRYKHFVPMAAGIAPDRPHDLVVVVRQSLTGRMATSTHRIVPN